MIGKAQASMEYVMVMGIILVVLIPLMYYSLNTSSENIKSRQAEDAINSLSNAVDDVYALNPGTKKYVWISIPGGVQNTAVNSSEISLTLSIGGSKSDIFSTTKAKVTGQIPTQQGTYKIPVEHLESGVVLIGEGNDTQAPVVVWKSPEGATCNPVTLRANTNEPATCKFDSSDKNYSQMTFLMMGNSLGHNYELGVQNEGAYLYYVRCSDVFNNAMNTSAVINFTVNLQSCGQTINETTPPNVTALFPPAGQYFNTTEFSYKEGTTDSNLCSFPGTNGDCGQSFTVGSQTLQTSTIKLYLKRVTASPSNVYLEVRSSSTVGTVIATSSQVTGSSLPSSLNWVTFSFSSPITLNAYTKYYLRLRSVPDSTNPWGSAVGTVNWGYLQSAYSPPAYSGGEAWRYIGRNSIPSYKGQVLSYYDFSFIINEGQVGSSVYVSNTSRIDFQFNVTDESPIISCSLNANNVTSGTIYAPVRNISNTITTDLNKGNYTWLVYCTDAFSNVGNSTPRQLIVNDTIDVDAPIVFNVAPLNNTIRNFNYVQFFYNVSDFTSAIFSCTLVLGGILDSGGSVDQQVTDFSVTENTSESIALSLDKGNYTWNVNCTDSSGQRNTGISNFWNLRINITLSQNQSLITSCPGQCGFSGYSNGVCRQEPPKCQQNGEIYIPAGDQFCTGGSQADTCCCVP